MIIDNEKIGTLETEYVYDRNVTNGAFKDKTTVTNIEKTNDDAYYINGELITEDQLSQNVIEPNAQSKTFAIAASQDTGGIPSISHYYGKYSTYYFASYQGQEIMFLRVMFLLIMLIGQ